jgi:hypothetical protein
LSACRAGATIPSMQRRARIAWRGKPRCIRKPFSGRCLPARLSHALGQIPPSQVPIPFTPPLPQQSGGLLEGFCPEPHAEEQIAVNSNGLMLFLRVADIQWLEAADTYVALHIGQVTHCVRETLASLAAKLPRGRFLRVSPSTLVNIAHLKVMPPGSLGPCHGAEKRAAAQSPAASGLPSPRLTSPGLDFRHRARRDFRNGDSRC